MSRQRFISRSWISSGAAWLNERTHDFAAPYVAIVRSMAAFGSHFALWPLLRAHRRDALCRGRLGNVAARRLSGALPEWRAVQPQTAIAVLADTAGMENIRRERLVAAADAFAV